VTQQGDEAKDTWRFAVDQQMQEEFKNGPLADWGFEGEGLAKSAKKMVKVLSSKNVSYWILTEQ